MQNRVRDMVVEWIHQKYIDSGFYPGASVNDDCALSVLGVASISQAKQNMAKFTAVVKMVSTLKQCTYLYMGLDVNCLVRWCS